MKIYKVGGAVRDQLLGIEHKDCDWVVVGASPDEMLEQGYIAVGKDFPVFLHPKTKEEYALARTERKNGVGYKGFEFHTGDDVTLEDDLLRRDITINAMAMDDDGNIIDPYNGKKDLEDKILRHVSDAFVEDPLRVLRVARFAARFGFKVSPETSKLMKQITESGELSNLVSERIWQELEKALAGKYPSRFLLVLRSVNALAVLFPEIECLFGVPQPKEHHPEIDTGLHTLMVLNQAARLTEDTEVRFAALVHDLGKGVTPEEMLPKHHGHEEAGVVLVESICERYKIPNRYRDLAVMVCRYHLICHRVEELKATTIVEKLEVMDAFRRPERFQQFLLACTADARGRSGKEDSEYPQADLFSEALRLVNQVDTKSIAELGLKGEEIAKEIRHQRVKQIESWKKTF